MNVHTFRICVLIGALGLAGFDCGGSASLECSPHASPVTVHGSATCACHPGYAGDGQTCAAIAVSLHGARWELPCISDDSNPSVCNTDPEPGFALSTTVTGPVGRSYDVTIRFRGVVEPKTYYGGTPDSSTPWYVGGAPSYSNWNIYSLEVSSPAATYYLNNGPDSQFYCIPLDFQKTVRMDVGAVVTLRANSVDGQEIKNVAQAGGSIIIPSVPPAPAAYDGQFIQMDVVSVTAAP
jgi:hypothetical protein